MLKLRSRTWAMLIVCVDVAVGCRRTAEPDLPMTVSSRPAPATKAAASETSDGNYFVTYATQPDPIPLNKMFSLEVNVFRDAKLQERPTGVTVEVDAGMPAHHHGMNLSPRVLPVSEGRFSVSGMLFHMPGQWEIYIDVGQGGRKERARFEVEVR